MTSSIWTKACEARDTKGLYAKARRGEIASFTGIDAPYEPPLKPEITLRTTHATPHENARRILRYVEARGLVRRDNVTARA